MSKTMPLNPKSSSIILGICLLWLIIYIYFVHISNIKFESVHLKNGVWKTTDQASIQLSDTLTGYPGHLEMRSRFLFGTKSSHNVGIATQVSFDKFDTIREMSSHWNGPISCSVLCFGDIRQVEEDIKKAIETWPQRSEPVTFHIVIQERNDDPYPVNIMRNFAMNHSSTDYVLILDADFVPNPDAWERILVWLEQRDGMVALDSKSAFIVPAFECVARGDQEPVSIEDLPQTKEILMQTLLEGWIQPFHFKSWPRGHTPTNFGKWYLASKPYGIIWEPRFEPYVIVNRHDVPQFWENFVGFGYNKLSFIMELNIAGFHFHVLPDVYIIHRTFAEELPRMISDEMQKEYTDEFRPHLRTKYHRRYIEDIECIHNYGRYC